MEPSLLVGKSQDRIQIAKDAKSLKNSFAKTAIKKLLKAIISISYIMKQVWSIFP